MATGFSVMDIMKNNKAGVEETPKARFRTKDISIHKMYRNEMNFYSIADIEELAGDILAFGLKQNLEVVYEPCEKGEYRIVAGERRWLALKLLVSKGYKEFETATCKLTAPQDVDEEQIEIIIANAYRNKNVADMIEEEKRLKKSLEKMKAAGKQIKGYDLSSGRLRDVIASMLHMSKTKVAQIESVNNNLIPEFQEELKSERLTFSAAYELSGLSGQEQQEALQQYKESGQISYKDIKNMKEDKAGQQGEIEADTEPPKADEEHITADEEYQTPHPQGITSLCYSCQKYSDCNVKTGTCTKCDQYVNKAEAEKTEEQRYSEEQDKIDKETAKKLREKHDEEKLKTLPSDIHESSQKVHQIRIGTTLFGVIFNREMPFVLYKNDKGFKEGDAIEMMEFTNGKYTGRSIKADVTYILEDFTGLVEGYCIMAIKVICMRGVDMTHK